MPTRNSLQITDNVLSGFALDFGKQNLVSLNASGMGMTADFLFPRVPHTVKGLTGEYYTYNLNNRFQLGDASRKEGNYNSIVWDVSSATYRIEDKGFSNDWDDREQEAAFDPVNLSEDAGDIIGSRVLLEYENEVVGIVTTSGNYNATVTNTNTAATVGTIWSNSGSDIVGAVTTMKKTIHKNCGVMPDRIVYGADVWTDGILKNDALLAGLQAQQKSGGLSDFDSVKAISRTFFGLDGAVDNTLYDTINPGGTATLDYLFGKNVVVYVSNKQIQRAKALRFGFTAVRPGEFMKGYKWFEQPHTHWRAVSFQRAVKLVEDSCAYLLTSVVA